MAANPPLTLWQVWWFSQTKSRTATDPAQPSDPSKDGRMYAIIAPVQNHWDKVTCCPIQNKDPMKPVGLTEVELLPSAYKFISKDSRILCHEIYTLPKIYFINQAGVLIHAEQAKIKTAISAYLRIP